MKLILSLMLAAGAAFAEEKTAKRSITDWLTHLKQGLEKSAVEGSYRKTNTQAQAAVRGSQQKADDPGKPYWKGGHEQKLAAQRKKERAELAAAVRDVLEGRVAEGEKKLDAFIAAYPASKYAKDAKEALRKVAELKALTAETDQPASAPKDQ